MARWRGGEVARWRGGEWCAGIAVPPRDAAPFGDVLARQRVVALGTRTPREKVADPDEQPGPGRRHVGRGRFPFVLLALERDLPGWLTGSTSAK